MQQQNNIYAFKVVQLFHIRAKTNYKIFNQIIGIINSILCQVSEKHKLLSNALHQPSTLNPEVSFNESTENSIFQYILQSLASTRNCVGKNICYTLNVLLTQNPPKEKLLINQKY